MSNQKLIYLASPHSNPDYMVMQNRYEKARDAVAILQRNNIMVFSPICHSHPPQMVNKNIKADYESYRSFDEKLISVMDEFWILLIEGWNKSKGIYEEYKFAKTLDKPTFTLSIDYYDLKIVRVESFDHIQVFHQYKPE